MKELLREYNEATKLVKKLEKKLAKEACPFKIGDIITNGLVDIHIDKITFYDKHPWFNLNGRFVSSSGKLTSRTSVINSDTFKLV